MPITVTQKDNPGDLKHHIHEACCHCGENIENERIVFDEKAFCCEGCKMVYDILNANDLAQYYEIEKQPGISWLGKKREKYAWLDDPEVVSSLIDFQNEAITKITLNLPQIHCASCIWLLENLYKLNEGVLQSKVNFLKKEAYITFDPQNLTLRKLVELLALIGYAPAINLDKIDDAQQTKTIDRTFQYQLGVAGFAFGNIMLLSFPEYLGLTESIFQQSFGYLNIALALPVVFFSGRDYLKAAWFGLRQRSLNIDVPITLGILTLFGRSVFEILTHTGAGYLDSLAGLVFFLLIGKWFQQKTHHRLSFERDYKSYFPIAAAIKKDGKESSITLNKLQAGDTVIVRHQELIPADGILLKGKAAIDYSFVTGESEPVAKKAGDKIFAGGRQLGDAIELTLTKKVSQSYLTQLWNEDTFQEKQQSASSQLADKVGKWFTFAILTIAFVTLFYWLPKDISLAINAFTAVLIIACPCAVALSIPFTFGNGLRLFAKQNFYLKNTQALENLSRVDTVVFDKTGTITDTTKSKIQYSGTPLTESEKTAIHALANQSTHPISKGISTLFKNQKDSGVTDFEEITGKGIQGFSNGYFVQIQKASNGTSVTLNGNFKGNFILKNSYRKGLNELLSKWKGLLSTYILSGDNNKERNFLKALFPSENLYFNQNPKDKLAFIKNLQQKGKTVLMLGDGLNDAGALQQSDVGIVVAENTNNFTPACNAILDAKQFEKLPQFLSFAKGSVRLVYFAYLLAFGYNVIGLYFACQGLLSPVIAAILMPLSSITIVTFGVGMSSLLFKKVVSMQ